VEAAMTDTIWILGVILMLLVYLVYALLVPEKF
jgi:K+-transporting ATPase KdpF subunit